MQEEFEDTKRVIKICISKKNRQHNDLKKKVQKNKQRSTKHAHEKDRIKRTPLKTGGELRCSGRAIGTINVTLFKCLIVCALSCMRLNSAY